ncbi:hypothetical protein SAMN04487926_105286 [Paraburkholderia steynii]|uniref:Uncharacterized protein n=1 Tax=Paraburkholderia steynii TaxID=1245441 RepID=A0A7Z7B5M4_9BURK|nr:hypothetical protein SAMN04487926_105286 [Paraburkholderia steynii]
MGVTASGRPDRPKCGKTHPACLSLRTSLQGQAQDRTGFRERKSSLADGRRAHKLQECFNPMQPCYRNTPLYEYRHLFVAIDVALAPTSRVNGEEGRAVAKRHSADTSQMRCGPWRPVLILARCAKSLCSGSLRSLRVPR